MPSTLGIDGEDIDAEPVHASLADRKKRGEAGMSVLKWKIAALQNKTRERERVLNNDRRDIELVPDFGATLDAHAHSATATIPILTTKLSASTTSIIGNGGGGCGSKRIGMRERLNLTQIQRGRELRRVEKQRKKTRHSLAGAAEANTHSTDTNDSREGDNDSARGTNDSGVNGSDRGDEEKSAIDDTHSHTSTNNDLLHTLQHEGGDGDALSLASSRAYHTIHRRRDKQDLASLRSMLDSFTPTHTTTSAGNDNSTRVGGVGAGNDRRRVLVSQPATLSSIIQRQHRRGGSQSAHGFNGINITVSRPTSQPSISTSTSANTSSDNGSGSSTTLSLSIHDIVFESMTQPPLLLPISPSLSLILSKINWAVFKARASHFASLWRSTECQSLCETLFWYSHLTLFQSTHTTTETDNDSMTQLSLLILERQNALNKMLEKVLKIGASDCKDSDRLYQYLYQSANTDTVTAIDDPIVSKGVTAIKDRFLTSTPIILSSVCFALLAATFIHSSHLMTEHLLNKLDNNFCSLLSGFTVTENSTKTWRKEFFVTNHRSESGSGGRSQLFPSDENVQSLRTLIKINPDYQFAGTDTNSGPGTSNHSSSQSLTTMFSTGDWAEDERERREAASRQSLPQSSLAALSPYEQELLSQLDARRHGRVPTGTMKMKCNVNGVSSLLSVGLDRKTPDSSWRASHVLRYAVPVPFTESKEQSHDMPTIDEIIPPLIDSDKLKEYQAMKHRLSSTHIAANSNSHRRSQPSAPNTSKPSTHTNSTSGGGGSDSKSLDDLKKLDKFNENDPLNVLTARTKRLILRYSTKPVTEIKVQVSDPSTSSDTKTHDSETV